MVLVKSTNVSFKLNIKIKELGRIAMPDELFEVSETRYKVLAGMNPYKSVFVRKASDEEVEAYYNKNEVVTETEVEEIVEELKPKKSKKKKETEEEQTENLDE